MRKYNAESPKQGSRRFNSIVKTKYIADLGIVYLWYTGSGSLPLATWVERGTGLLCGV